MRKGDIPLFPACHSNAYGKLKKRNIPFSRSQNQEMREIFPELHGRSFIAAG